jgi:hypothetical protein
VVNVPPVPPPENPAGTPELVQLPANTVLYRIHPIAFQSTAFNPSLAHRYFGGGRFDATSDDEYAFLYAGDTELGTVAETLLRDSPIDATGAITVPHVSVHARRLSAIELTGDLTLVKLIGLEALRRCSQDTWLVQANPPEYPQTRHWGHWIRSQAEDAAGFVWPSKRDPTRSSYILFKERCPPHPLREAAPPVDDTFDDPGGLAHLRTILATLNADVETPLAIPSS